MSIQSKVPITLSRAKKRNCQQRLVTSSKFSRARLPVVYGNKGFARSVGFLNTTSEREINENWFQEIIRESVADCDYHFLWRVKTILAMSIPPPFDL